MILLKIKLLYLFAVILYVSAAIEIIFIVCLVLERLKKNIGDMKISNLFNDKLTLEKKRLNKKIKILIVAFVITKIFILLYSKYAILIVDYMGDMMSPLWKKIIG